MVGPPLNQGETLAITRSTEEAMAPVPCFAWPSALACAGHRRQRPWAPRSISARCAQRTDGLVLDVAITANGQRTYVLLAEGKVSVHDAGGLSLGSLPVPAKGPSHQHLSGRVPPVRDADGRSCKTIAVETGSRARPGRLPVSWPGGRAGNVAVFNDFQ